MSLHNLNSLTVEGAQDVEAARGYYEDWGSPAKPTAGCRRPTAAGEFRLVPAARRQLLQMEIGVDDPDDMGRITGQLVRRRRRCFPPVRRLGDGHRTGHRRASHRHGDPAAGPAAVPGGRG